ncbi:LysR substrate-binding domain-containing protein [Duganella radicis]|uniref:LysR family transcriptional regulator n=1 Tax=Duganella radicis TaxID=551988 RepID=A0A6L6PFC3_9BURK|nr:LysR substrate-binding domain-containing protein [Duganella radicis]MTV36985.1 LysR family transcriptional regulator [Duganella radicis]
MNNLDDLSCFVAVVRHQGFSAAARATRVEKTRLSRRVAALEQRLGVRLLQRSTRSVALTEAGARFYADSLKIVEAAQLALANVAQLRDEPAGLVRISCPQALAAADLSPILSAYLAAHPKVRVELEHGDTPPDLSGQQCDIALRSSLPAGSLSGLVVRELGGVRRQLLASRDFLDRHGRPGTPKELAMLDAVAAPGDVRDGLVHWRLLGAREHKTTVTLSPRLQSGDLPTQLAAAAHGLGIACLPAHAVKDQPGTSQLERVLPNWAVIDSPLYAIYPAQRGMLPSVRGLVACLLAQLPPLLAPPPEAGACAFAL